MNILKISALFLFAITGFLCVVVYVGRNKELYEKFFTWWLNFWGIPKEMQKHIPMSMYTQQAKNTSWLFGFLALVTLFVGLYIFSLSFE